MRAYSSDTYTTAECNSYLILALVEFVHRLRRVKSTSRHLQPFRWQPGKAPNAGKSAAHRNAQYCAGPWVTAWRASHILYQLDLIWHTNQPAQAAFLASCSASHLSGRVISVHKSLCSFARHNFIYSWNKSLRKGRRGLQRKKAGTHVQLEFVAKNARYIQKAATITFILISLGFLPCTLR